MARGYFHRPELTAERFIRHPFSTDPQARLYKTGDLVRWLPDGNLEFLGRRDDQVKIRGFRVEVGEVEAVLARHAAVKESVVLAREDVPGEKRLVAYVVPRTQPPPAASALRSDLQQQLPDYMVPAAFVMLESLPPPECARADADQPRVGPRSAVEQRLVAVWAKLLKLPPQRISVHDNFFELGGHSLLAVRLFAEIEKLSGRNLPLATLFQAPTVAQLAGILSR